MKFIYHVAIAGWQISKQTETIFPQFYKMYAQNDLIISSVVL